MWNGVFAPRLNKHRDHLHDTVADHLRDAYGPAEVGPPVPVVASPITGELLDDETYYYEVTFKMEGANGEVKEYIFLVVSKTDGEPTEEEITEQVDAQLKNPLPGGRLLNDLVADWYIEQLDDDDPRVEKYKEMLDLRDK